MAISDAYATALEYRASVNKDDTSEDAEILTDLTAVSRYMERKLGGRCFNKDASAVKRTFTPTHSSVLDIDDLVLVTTIKIDEDADGSFADETALATTDYLLLPRNAAVGPEPSPYTMVELPSWSTKGTFTPQCPVEIDAVWGWPAVPAAINRACIHLTGVLRLETPRSSRSVSDVGMILETSSEARGIITDLMRVYRKAAVA